MKLIVNSQEDKNKAATLKELLERNPNSPFSKSRVTWPNDVQNYQRHFAAVCHLPISHYPHCNKVKTKLPASNMEYVIFANDNTKVNEDDLKNAYEVLMKFKFPMNTNPNNRQHINRLTSKEQALMLSNEGEFIEQQCQKINPAFQIIALPKSLYQLYYFVSKEHAFKAYDANCPANTGKNSSNVRRDRSFSVNFKYQPSDGDYNSFCTLFLKDARLIHHWIYTNCYIIKQLSDKMKILQQPDEAILFKEVQTLVSHLADKNTLSLGIGYRSLHETRRIFRRKGVATLATMIVNDEWQARHDQGTHLIYRGADEKPKKSEKIAKSLSYSDGIFGGAIFDADSGMALGYVVNKDRKLYKLTINKQNYYDKKEDYQCFFIPPVPALVAACGDKEYHHPRSKISPSTTFKCKSISTETYSNLMLKLGGGTKPDIGISDISGFSQIGLDTFAEPAQAPTDNLQFHHFGKIFFNSSQTITESDKALIKKIETDEVLAFNPKGQI